VLSTIRLCNLTERIAFLIALEACSDSLLNLYEDCSVLNIKWILTSLGRADHNHGPTD
jgi:hypothetical protein